MLGAVRRLAVARRRDAKLRRMLQLAPAIILVGLGWLAHAGLGPLSVTESQASAPAPMLLTAAISTHEVSLLRSHDLSTRDRQPGSRRDALGNGYRAARI